MTTFRLYGIWKRVLAQWRGDDCPTRRTNLIWLIVGLYLSGKVQTSAIVARWPMTVQRSSLTRRLSRFLDNGAVRPAVWFRPVARQLLARTAQHCVTLIIDASKVGAGHQLVIVALAYRQRALPLAWTWVPYAKGGVPTDTQLALLTRVQGLLPEGAQVILVGDAGFSSVVVLRQLEAWHYGLRQKAVFLFQSPQQTDWERLDSLVTAAGQQVWLAAVRLTVKWQHLTAVLAYWRLERPWPGYRKQHLRHPARLSHLVLASALLYVWLVLWGERLIKAGLRAWVDHSDRRDLSVVHSGLVMLHRCSALLRECPSPRQVS